MLISCIVLTALLWKECSIVASSSEPKGQEQETVKDYLLGCKLWEEMVEV
jgi:hypothetical protein